MARLFNEVNGAFDEGFIAKAATTLDESESDIKQALNGALPAAFTRLVQKTDNTAGSMDVYNMANEAADSGAAANPATLLSGGDLPGISEIDTSLFGDKLAGIASALSRYAHIRQSSAVAILTIAGITTLGFLGLHVREYELSAADLGHTIQSQKKDLLSTVPSGFNLATALGLASLSEIGTNVQNINSNSSAPNSFAAYTAKRSTAWIVPAIFLLIIVVLVWNLMKSCNQHKAQPPVAVPKSQEP